MNEPRRGEAARRCGRDRLALTKRRGAGDRVRFEDLDDLRQDRSRIQRALCHFRLRVSVGGRGLMTLKMTEEGIEERAGIGDTRRHTCAPLEGQGARWDVSPLGEKTPDFRFSGRPSVRCVAGAIVAFTSQEEADVQPPWGAMKTQGKLSAWDGLDVVAMLGVEVAETVVAEGHAGARLTAHAPQNRTAKIYALEGVAACVHDGTLAETQAADAHPVGFAHGAEKTGRTARTGRDAAVFRWITTRRKMNCDLGGVWYRIGLCSSHRRVESCGLFCQR